MFGSPARIDLGTGKKKYTSNPAGSKNLKVIFFKTFVSNYIQLKNLEQHVKIHLTY